MLPKYIKVKNFTSYIQEVIDFSSYPDIFIVVGNNGVGKSSIVEMMTTAIFYRARGVNEKGTGMDNLINKDANEFEIEFSFTMNNNEYIIKRRKIRNGGHELEFFINGISQTEKLTETQNKINNIIKMDYETFLDTVCIGQGQSGRFMQKKPNERKEVFVQVLGLDKYEKLEEYTRNLKRETKQEIDKISDKINNFQNDINSEEYYLSIIQTNESKINNSKSLIKEKEDELEKVLAEKVKYEQIKKQADHILNQRSFLLKKLNTLKQNIQADTTAKQNLEEKLSKYTNIESKISDKQKDLDNYQLDYNELIRQKSTLEAKINMLKSQAKEFKIKYDKMKDYNEGNCGFCGHEITSEYKTVYLKDLMDQGKTLIVAAKAEEGKLNSIEIELETFKTTIIEHKQHIQNLQNTLNQVIQARTQVQSLETRITDSYNQLKDTSEEYRKNIEIKINTIEEKTFNDNILRNQIINLRSELTKLESDYAIAKNQIQKINAAKVEVNNLNQQYKQLELLHDDYEDLIMAWGKSGIQAAIIRNALPEIEVEINKLLQLLCNGRVTVEFNTEKASKGKKVSKKPTSIETLEIIVNDQGESRTYETYSGGEQFRVDFACHVGLAKFLAKRAGATIDFFIVDEGLGSQDDNARQQFVTSVYKLTESFKQVMCITHIEEIKDAFGAKLLITKDPIDGSKVQLIEGR
jgi:exonuclease SbcC